ncbi:MAG TPA: adenosine-specific kinase, partial [Terracidiphilus sp.]
MPMRASPGRRSNTPILPFFVVTEACCISPRSNCGKLLQERDEKMETLSVRMEIPEGANLILGQAHFIKTAED